MKFYQNVPKYRLLAVEKWAKSIKIDVFGMADLQSAQNSSKNDKNVIFIFFPKNSNPDLHFDIGFDGIRQLEQFLYNFEICFQNRWFSSILLLMTNSDLPVSATSVNIWEVFKIGIYTYKEKTYR